jgi:hypothetical protein
MKGSSEYLEIILIRTVEIGILKDSRSPFLGVVVVIWNTLDYSDTDTNLY